VRLAAVWDALDDLAAGRSDAHELANSLGVAPARLALYGEFIAGHLADVLAKDFAALRAVVPPATWTALVAAYARAHPPTDYELNHAGANLPGFVADAAARGELGLAPWHGELAAVEWAEFVAWAAPVDVAAARLLGALAVNPTLELIACDHAIVALLDATRRSPTPALVDAPIARPEVALAYRHPRTHRAHVIAASAGQLLALKLVHERIPLTAAATETGLDVAALTTLLDDAVADGLLLAPA
jgi:hypothetical protein